MTRDTPLLLFIKIKGTKRSLANHNTKYIVRKPQTNPWFSHNNIQVLLTAGNSFTERFGKTFLLSSIFSLITGSASWMCSASASTAASAWSLNNRAAASIPLLKPWWKSPSMLRSFSMSFLCSSEWSSHLEAAWVGKRAVIGITLQFSDESEEMYCTLQNENAIQT